MKVLPIISPVSGERVVGVHPAIEVFPELDWRRRLNNFTGRALTHTALLAEQRWRNGRLAAMGQLVSPGVITGLETGAGKRQVEDKTLSEIHISPGIALTAAGEIVTFVRPVSALFQDIFVHGHPLSIEEADNTLDKALYAEELKTLGNVIENGTSLPPVAFLVLEPVYAEINIKYDTQDPCEVDPTDFAFENWQQVDSSRLVLYFWPGDFPLPAVGDQWRNRLAYSIFMQERDNDRCQLHPWEKYGVPIALIGFDAQWEPLFIDRNAVVRAGGKRRRTNSILPDIGNRFLWQAQFYQFNEQLAEFITDPENINKEPVAKSVFDEIDGNLAGELAGVGIIEAVENKPGFVRFDDSIKDEEQLRTDLEQIEDFFIEPVLNVWRQTPDVVPEAEEEFRYLPPVGVLPKDYIDTRDGKQEFFPVNYKVEAIAIPHEQLDVVVRNSAPLAPFDLHRADRVKVFVPVPQIYYEPGLLRVEEIDEEFDQTIRRFTKERNIWLGRRLDVRRKASAIVRTMKGEPLIYLSPDPNAVDNMELSDPFEKAVIEIGHSWRYIKGNEELTTDWKEIGSNDSSWLSGPTAMGYGEDQYETELDDMEGFYDSLYCRKTFTFDEDESTAKFKLIVATNGSFIAYLGSRTFNSPANGSGEPVQVEFDFDGLAAGSHVLAIEVHNVNIDSPSFIFAPRLIKERFVRNIGEQSYGTGVIMNNLGALDLDLTVIRNEFEDIDPGLAEKLTDDGIIKDDEIDPDRVRFVDDNKSALREKLELIEDIDIKAILDIWERTLEPVYRVKEFGALKKYLATRTPLSDCEVAQLEKKGLEGFIDFLQKKVDIANDKVDIGFVQLQTDIYRVRQIVLGNKEGTKLATSPVLAAIAKSETAVATKKEINDFVSRLKEQAAATSRASMPPSSSPAFEATYRGPGPSASPAFSSAPAGNIRDAYLSTDIAGINLGARAKKSAPLMANIEMAPGEVSPGSMMYYFAQGNSESGYEAVLEHSIVSSGLFFGESGITKDDIQGQTPIVGAVERYHNITIAERLDEPLATGAKAAAVATKAEVIAAFAITPQSEIINISEFDEIDQALAKRLEAKEIFKNVNNEPGNFRFHEKIKDESHLITRLKEINEVPASIKQIVTVWRQTHNEELDDLIMVDDIIIPGFREYIEDVDISVFNKIENGAAKKLADGGIIIDVGTDKFYFHKNIMYENQLRTYLEDIEISKRDEIVKVWLYLQNGVERAFPFRMIRENGLVGEVLSGIHDKNKSGMDDESAFFNAAIRALENTTAVLRKIEGRIHAYKRAIAKCKQTLGRLKSLLNNADIRLKTLADELAESRHDVTVSRALKAEEESRIDAINERRDSIIKEHVPFLMFCRPRLTDARVDIPVHTLNPDLSEAPLPACDIDGNETPEEISAMMDVLREAPLKWFAISKKVLKRLNRLNDLRITLQGARVRARTKATKHPLLNVRYENLDRLKQGIGKALFSSQKIVFTRRKKTAAIDLAVFNRFGWKETASRAQDVLSLGDLIDGNHGRVSASSEASRELDQIACMATSLYLRFGQILPSIRLDWAERLSQFDAPINLRNLYSLPRWGEVEYIERQEMQMLVDWLYQRVDATYSEVVSLISDLIRICILLASHAPVNKIIAGHIPEPTTVRVGSKINVVANLARVRIGMNVMMQSGGKIVARGTVEDIVGGQITAHVLKTIKTTVLLEKNARVQIGEPRSLGSKQFGVNKLLLRKN